MNGDKVKKIIEEKFPHAEYKLIDLVGDDNHYQLEITMPEFEGKSALQRHKIVNDELKSLLAAELHAITIKTRAPK